MSRTVSKVTQDISGSPIDFQWARGSIHAYGNLGRYETGTFLLFAAIKAVGTWHNSVVKIITENANILCFLKMTSLCFPKTFSTYNFRTAHLIGQHILGTKKCIRMYSYSRIYIFNKYEHCSRLFYNYCCKHTGRWAWHNGFLFHTPVLRCIKLISVVDFR